MATTPTDAPTPIQEALARLESDARKRIERRVASAPERRSKEEGGSVNQILATLRETEQLVNDVKRKRGEEPVQLVKATSRLGEQERGEAERIFAEQHLDPNAMMATIGVLLSKGDEDEAIKLLEPAAEGGDAMAAQTLGLILERRGETERALELQRQAADQGDHMALYNYGRMLHERGDDPGALHALRRSQDPRAAALAQEIEAG